MIKIIRYFVGVWQCLDCRDNSMGGGRKIVRESEDCWYDHRVLFGVLMP